MNDIHSHTKRVHRLKVEHAQAREFVRTEEEALEEVKQRVEDTLEAQTIVQHVAQALQQRIHQQIAGVVTQCLNAVFDEPYEFKIRFDRKRGQTEAQLVFVRDGLELDDPLNEVGGGVVDVAALALRLACLLLSRPQRRRLLVLDEPLRNVRGKQNRQRVRDMLLEVAERMDFQFVLNVDSDAYPEFALGQLVAIGE